MDEINRLIANFEFDRRKADLLDEPTAWFLEDLAKLLAEYDEERLSESDVKDAYDEGYETGKQHGHDEGYDEGYENARSRVLGALEE